MPSSSRPVILTLLGAYWPAADANGPVRSLVHLLRALSPEFEFRIIGRDRPYGGEPVAGAEIGRWIPHEGGFVRHEAPSTLGLGFWSRLMSETPHDLLYVNSVFEPRFAVLPLMARWLAPTARPAIVAPRGELSPGAIRIRRGRKAAFLAATKAAKVHDSVVFHATAEREIDDIRNFFPRNRIVVAPNIPLMRRPAGQARSADGPLRVLYLSRIARKKNLALALRAFSKVKIPAALDIHGPISEPDYWRECQPLMHGLPSHLSVAYRGEIAGDKVPETLAAHDLFFLPTASENFGHAIVEALAAGVPVLISDQTPWRDLEPAEAGFDLALDDAASFTRAIERFAGFDEGRRARFSEGAVAYARRNIDVDAAIGAHRAMFASLLGAG